MIDPGNTALDLAAVKDRLLAGCDAIVAARDRLTKADQATGDGDHGVGMARGFTAAAKALSDKPAASVGDLFKTLGMAVMSTSGGASGAVFGTFFMSAGGSLNEPLLTAEAFVAALRRGLEAVQARGGAKPGDKTMIDALVPAIEGAEGQLGADIGLCLAAAAAGARDGVESTKAMRAATGKARSLGDRSIGHLDPGALSLAIFLTAFAGDETS